MSSLFRLGLFGALVLFWPASAEADIYACANADGSTDYTNVRTPGRRCRRIVEGRAGARGRQAAASMRTRRRAPRRADPGRFTRYDAYIAEAAALYQLPVHFIRAVVKSESNFNASVVSVDGAAGLMQLMPRTARAMGVRDAFDPRQNIFGGARYLRVLANRFDGDLVLTVAAYNAGPGAVERYRGVPPYAETQRYVRRVLGHYYRLRAGGSITGPR
ncbi:MAG: lytic transglycosylase domain-containing protein [Myxococcota bacterium]